MDGGRDGTADRIGVNSLRHNYPRSDARSHFIAHRCVSLSTYLPHACVPTPTLEGITSLPFPTFLNSTHNGTPAPREFRGITDGCTRQPTRLREAPPTPMHQW